MIIINVAAEKLRESIVSPAKRSPEAIAKTLSKRTEDDLPVHSFQTLLLDLQTVVKNRIRFKDDSKSVFEKITTPTNITTAYI